MTKYFVSVKRETDDIATVIELGDDVQIAWGNGVSIGSDPDCTIVLPELPPVAAQAVKVSNHKYLCLLPAGTSLPLPPVTFPFDDSQAIRVDDCEFQLGQYLIEFSPTW